MFNILFRCAPGNSGGPIFSDKGYFVGMVTEHLERKTA